jgi:glycogen synthase
MHAAGLALSTLRKHPEDFEGIQARGMVRDSSWNAAAKTYEQVFEWAGEAGAARAGFGRAAGAGRGVL